MKNTYFNVSRSFRMWIQVHFLKFVVLFPWLCSSVNVFVPICDTMYSHVYIKNSSFLLINFLFLFGIRPPVSSANHSLFKYAINVSVVIVTITLMMVTLLTRWQLWRKKNVSDSLKELIRWDRIPKWNLHDEVARTVETFSYFVFFSNIFYTSVVCFLSRHLAPIQVHICAAVRKTLLHRLPHIYPLHVIYFNVVCIFQLIVTMVAIQKHW